MSIREVLVITAQNLRGIMLPVSMAETAAQIAKSTDNLVECIRAIDREVEENKKAKEPEEENPGKPELEEEMNG